MDNESEFNVFKCLDYIRDKAPEYARAKSEKDYLEQFLKTKRSLCMREAEKRGFTSAVMQEREALCDPEYLQILDGHKIANERQECLKWLLIAAQMKVEVWRTISANRRTENKVI